MTTAGGQIAIFRPKNIQNISVLLTSPQFEPFGYRPKPRKNSKIIFYTYLGVF